MIYTKRAPPSKFDQTKARKRDAEGGDLGRDLADHHDLRRIAGK